jgi:hypothetical protein
MLQSMTGTRFRLGWIAIEGRGSDNNMSLCNPSRRGLLQVLHVLRELDGGASARPVWPVYRNLRARAVQLLAAKPLGPIVVAFQAPELAVLLARRWAICQGRTASVRKRNAAEIVAWAPPPEGAWPTQRSAGIEEAPGETSKGINRAL